MNFTKQISELQERNKRKLTTCDFVMTDDQKVLDGEDIDKVTTDSFNAGALAVIEEAKKPFASIIENSKYSKPHSEEDKAALKCTQVFLDHLTALEAALQDNK